MKKNQTENENMPAPKSLKKVNKNTIVTVRYLCSFNQCKTERNFLSIQLDQEQMIHLQR